ncbi:phage tail protein [Xenorhabdus lircayensis]|uniref:Phage tail protein n=1 Tax=Xenorhabdus lircayensis TaxID=2763499 RepID=A0ABS0U4V1_9GAMM|nr:phage tail protein [Xenorhabdus lircayensis]MBI6548912.1 phage tail protein [Xenorhabdus lircayensis]
MSSVITTDFEKWKAQQVAAGHSVVLDEFVFANVPGLDPSQDISRSEQLPAAQYIVHRQAVNKTGLASENAVAYSVTLGTEVGNFDFNWIGLLNKASGVIGMITHAPTQKKIKTANGLQGNVLTRSFLLEFDGASKETAITTTAETWQIDFTARLSGMDEMQRLMNTDSYGEAAFFGDGSAVIRTGDQYTVKKGLAYVGGLRGVLEYDQTLNQMRNTRVYVDFSYQGNLVSQWKTVVKITVANDLKNYVDAAGYPHYVFAIASIDGNGNVIDLRSKGTLSDRGIAELNREIGRVKQDYATNQALNAVNDNANNRLAMHLNGADIPDKKLFINNLGLSKTVEQAGNAVPSNRTINGKSLSDNFWLLPPDIGALDKSKNGADIPDINAFIDNLWLRGTVERAENAVSADGGDYSGAFRFKQVGTLPLETSAVSLNSLGYRPAYSLVSNTKYDWYQGTIETGLIRGHKENIEGYAVDINHRRVLMVAPDGLLTVNRIALTDFTDFDSRYDSRYISRTRLGRESSTIAALLTAKTRAPDGHVMTGIGNVSTQAWVGVNELLHRPIQCFINGQWRSIDVEV